MNRKRSQRLLGLIVASGLWGVLPLLFHRDTAVAYALPAYAALLSCALLALDNTWLRPRLRFTARDALIGAGVGVAMTAATYPLYELAVELFPELAAQVAADYTLVPTEAAAAYLPRLLIVVLAEELLFRGSWLRANHHDVTPAALHSLLAYGLSQMGWGSFAVILASVICGSIWLATAKWTQSLIAPLIAHAIWSSVVLLFWPLAS
jgi:uncharacterized protein